MIRGVLAAAAALVAFPAQAVTISFNPGSYQLVDDNDPYDFYKSAGYFVTTDGTIANGYATNRFIQLAIDQVNTYQSLSSFDVRGSGTLRLQNFDVCCHPIDYYPIVEYALTGDWQTIDFDPELKGFFFQLSADAAFDIDNIVFGANAVPPPGAVPEPATWAMMLLGFGALGVRARAKSRTISRFA